MITALISVATFVVLAVVVAVFVCIAVLVAPKGDPRRPSNGAPLTLEDLMEDEE